MTKEIRYKIYRIENGLLLEPTDSYHNRKYSSYETMEEALEACDSSFGDLVILPVVNVVFV